MGASSSVESSAFSNLVLHDYCEKAYLQYAMAVTEDRAIPFVQDGLKPVQRRLLYVMDNLKLRSTENPVKSARVVGEVLGKFHPHGDSAAYEAMVRMAQDFSLRYPIVLGQGNFGSRDGDSAAAMRYTEAKLTPLAELLLNELGKNTVDFKENYDGKDKEPVVLPARLPFVLINGAMGVAVALSCDIPPHNLKEVAQAAVLRIQKPNSTLDEVMSVLPGPDFPDGGQVISPSSDIAKAYETGNGTIRVRARWRKEELARGQWQIVVHELPYQVSVTTILEQIDKVTSPEPPKGAKQLKVNQANLKQLSLSLLERVVDESSAEEEIRLVISPKTSKVDPEELMAFLCANTDLEKTIKINLTVMGLDGAPRRKNLLTILDEWSSFRITTVRRRTEFELAQAQKRIHILEGRQIVFLNIDEVIAIIRASDDPKADLMSRFGLSEIQAEDILEIRLRQLARLEGIKIEAELKELKTLETKLLVILGSETKLKNLVIKEIEADAEKFGDERRSVLEEAVRSVPGAAAARSVKDEPVTVWVSKNLFIKSKPGHTLDPAELAVKTGDAVWQSFEIRSVDEVFVLDDSGRAFSIRASDIPSGRGDGVPLTSLIELKQGVRIAHLLSGAPESRFLFSNSDGVGFISKLENLSSRQKAGKAFQTLPDGTEMLCPVQVPGEGGFAYFATDEGRLLLFKSSEINELDKGGKGVKLVNLPQGAKLSTFGFLAWAKEGERPIEIEVSGVVKNKPVVAKLGEDASKYFLSRAKKGAQAPKKMIVSEVRLLSDKGTPFGQAELFNTEPSA